MVINRSRHRKSGRGHSDGWDGSPIPFYSLRPLCPPLTPPSLCRPAGFPFHLNPRVHLKLGVARLAQPFSKPNRPAEAKNRRSLDGMREWIQSYQPPTVKAGEAINEITALNGVGRDHDLQPWHVHGEGPGIILRFRDRACLWVIKQLLPNPVPREDTSYFKRGFHGNRRQ